MRVLSHGAVLVQIAASAGMVTLALAGHLGAAAFIPLMMLVMLVTGLVFANFNALAMQPQGHVAGIASSVTGALSTLLGALIGFAIGQSFDGTALPLAAGFLGCGLLTLGLLLVTERGRLLRAGGA
jgi:DHA1 family bicyclomycin/chloramphenicol resistance-like MFS transporter